jgi:hypothetical protein
MVQPILSQVLQNVVVCSGDSPGLIDGSAFGGCVVVQITVYNGNFR